MKSFFDKIEIDKHFSGELSNIISSFILKYYDSKFIDELLNDKKITTFNFNVGSFYYENKLPKVINNENLRISIEGLIEEKINIEKWTINYLLLIFPITTKIYIKNISSKRLYISRTIRDYHINFDDFDVILYGSHSLK
jgi:hypothetical protein